jgi:hypothetical protein
MKPAKRKITKKSSVPMQTNDEDAPQPELSFHPLSEMFPLLEGERFTELVEDIRRNGLQHKISLYEGKILDGRNRYRAARELGIEIQTEIYSGTDPLGYVLSANLHRRHLSENQRGMMAASVATRPRGASRDACTIPTGLQAAEMFNVGTSTVDRAKVVRRNGVPELIQAVESGEIGLLPAQGIARLPAPEQQKFLQEANGDRRGRQTRRPAKKPKAPKLPPLPEDAEPIEEQLLRRLRHFWVRTIVQCRKQIEPARCAQIIIDYLNAMTSYATEKQQPER